MAHVARPTYTRLIPQNAERCKHKGKPAVRWRGRGKKWVYGIICKDPRRCLVESGKHRLHYTDHEGRPAATKGYTDRGASEHLLQSLVTKSARIAAGQLLPSAIRPRLTLTELLEKWRRYISANGATVGGADRQHQRARDVCDGIHAIRVADLTPTAVLEWIDGRRLANFHKKKAFGESTAANYLGAAKSFTRWSALVEKCEPVDHLSALRVKRSGFDTRVNRRALSDFDLRRFLIATKSSEAIHYGLTGVERHGLYLLACSSGLRALELASLGRDSFDLANFDVEIKAGQAKNRRGAFLPLGGQVLAALKPLLMRAGDGPIWPNRVKSSAAWWKNGARMIRKDLAVAGVPFEVAGRRFDFHSLRGQFATDLDRAGVSLTRAQKLMRHSTPTLTAKFYQRPEHQELASEVGKLNRGR